jgi:hypothetical protein
MSDRAVVMANMTDTYLVGEEAEKVSGDVKASWRIAEAFKRETVFSDEFQPGVGIAAIEMGLEEGESEEIRFRLTGELTARLVALDQSDEARSMIMSVRDQFADESKQQQMDAWLVRGDEVKKYYENLREKKAEEEDSFASEEYAKELKRRSIGAEKQGNKQMIHRYQKTAASVEEKLEQKTKSKKN